MEYGSINLVLGIIFFLPVLMLLLACAAGINEEENQKIYDAAPRYLIVPTANGRFILKEKYQEVYSNGMIMNTLLKYKELGIYNSQTDAKNDIRHLEQKPVEV